LTYLESLVGEATFQDFLRTYILKHSLSSVTYEDLKNTWEAYINANVTANATAIIAAVNWTQWVTVPGLSPTPLNFTTAESNNASALADAYIALAGKSSPNFTEYTAYYSNLKVVFHLELLNRQ
jgi:hypothetical protein